MRFNVRSCYASCAMNSRLALAIAWLLFGSLLLLEGIYEVVQWKTDPMLGESSLRWWHSTGIIPGALSLVLAYQLAWSPKFAKYLGYFLSVLLLLYTVYVLAITPNEFVFRPMLAVQVFTVLLCIATAVHLYRSVLDQSRDVTQPDG